MAEPLESTIAKLRAFDRKVIGGVVVTMIRHHDRVREREWMSEQLVSAVALAMDEELEFAASAADGVDAVQGYARANVDRLMQIAFALFARVAADLRSRPGFRFEDAVGCALAYLGSGDGHD